MCVKCICPQRFIIVGVSSITALRYSRLYFRVESSANMTGKTRKPGETPPLVVETKKSQPTVLFLLLGDMRALESNAVPGLSPCWDHVIHIVQSRDVPLDPKHVRALNLNLITLLIVIAIR